MDFSNEQIEKIINDTFPGMAFYYRDADLEEEITNKYQFRQIIRNGIFLDVSSLGGKQVKNTRFLIATSKARALFHFNPDVEKWRLHTINLNSYFQVLDIHNEDSQTQILLVQIPKDGVDLFQAAWLNILDDIVRRGKESFAEKKLLEPIPALQEEEWIRRTEFPIGLDANNNFFELFPEKSTTDSGKEPAMADIIASALEKIGQDNEIKQEEKPVANEDREHKKPGFWGRLFGGKE